MNSESIIVPVGQTVSFELTNSEKTTIGAIITATHCGEHIKIETSFHPFGLRNITVIIPVSPNEVLIGNPDFLNGIVK